MPKNWRRIIVGPKTTQHPLEGLMSNEKFQLTFHRDKTIARAVLNILRQYGLNIFENLRLQRRIEARLLKRIEFHVVQKTVIVEIAYLR